MIESFIPASYSLRLACVAMPHKSWNVSPIPSLASESAGIVSYTHPYTPRKANGRIVLVRGPVSL
jgi:hypothetical protein